MGTNKTSANTSATTCLPLIKCKGCGHNYTMGQDCPACSTTKEIGSHFYDVVNGSDSIRIYGERELCGKCGTKKKWVVITQREGAEFICPKC